MELTSTPFRPGIESPTTSPLPTSTETLCAESGHVELGTYPSTIAVTNLNFRIYLPPCFYDGDRRYPTLYIFHGSVQDDSHWDILGLDSAADSLIRSGELPPFLIVMPNGGWSANHTSGGPGSFEAIFLTDLMPFVESNYCAWPERNGRAIGGLSRGGYWALEIAFRQPELFVSVGGHSAALLDIAAGPALNPQFTGLANDLDGLRIYLDIGGDDYVIENIRRLHQDMLEKGIDHEWWFNQGSHGDDYWSAHVNDYLLWYSQPWSRQFDRFPPCSD